MTGGFIFKRLSGKLLLLTILFVMLAEILALIPSVAIYRQNWLAERAEAAGLVTLALEGVPNYKGTEMLSEQFMIDTSVSMVAQKREGRSQVVLGMPPVANEIIVADLRSGKRLSMGATFHAFFCPGDGYIRILSDPTVIGVDALEVLVPESALKTALVNYAKRVLLWSALIAVLTGLMIYLALSRMIVRPLQKLAGGLAAFREDPRKRISAGEIPARRDEIGDLQREFVDMKEGVRDTFNQQERLATLGLAMAKINHDLRNVLTSTQLISDRLAMDKEDRVRSMGERLVKAVDRGVKLCEATLSFVQKAHGKPNSQSFSLASVLDEAAQDTKTDTNNFVFSNKVPSEFQAWADPDQAYRIFHNLFRNAAQAMEGRQNSSITVNAELLDGKVDISVADNGPGLPERARENLFKAFTSSTTKGGTGLGLTIARELARANSGNLRLEATGADGTEFIVSFPIRT